MARALLVAAAALAVALVVAPARAAEGVLTLEGALARFRAHGAELALAEARLRGAAADAAAARALPNPSVALGYARAPGYDASACPGCSADGFSVGVTEQGALSQILAGKRAARARAADLAVDGARVDRADALRLLERRVKERYVEAVRSGAALAFAQEVQSFLTAQLALNRLRYPSVINEGQLARVEGEKLEADQGVDAAERDRAQAYAALAQALGEADARLPSGVVLDPEALRYRVPPALRDASVEAALRSAGERPDVRSAAIAVQQAEASVDAARRGVVPDVALGLQYQQMGTGTQAVQPPTLGVVVSAPIPLFYAAEGEIGGAEARRAGNDAELRRRATAAAAEVRVAWAEVAAARRLVERIESTMLGRARRARDVTQAQFDAGSATLMDFLDAQRTFVSTNVEHLDLLARYWSAVFALEEAVGAELRR